MSDLSKFADDLEQLILTHAAEAGIEIAETVVEHLIKVVMRVLRDQKGDANDE